PNPLGRGTVARPPAPRPIWMSPARRTHSAPPSASLRAGPKSTGGRLSFFLSLILRFPSPVLPQRPPPHHHAPRFAPSGQLQLGPARIDPRPPTRLGRTIARSVSSPWPSAFA